MNDIECGWDEEVFQLQLCNDISMIIKLVMWPPSRQWPQGINVIGLKAIQRKTLRPIVHEF